MSKEMIKIKSFELLTNISSPGLSVSSFIIIICWFSYFILYIFLAEPCGLPAQKCILWRYCPLVERLRNSIARRAGTHQSLTQAFVLLLFHV